MATLSSINIRVSGRSLNSPTQDEDSILELEPLSRDTVISSIFPSCPGSNVDQHQLLSWYSGWLDQQLTTIPAGLIQNVEAPRDSMVLIAELFKAGQNIDRIAKLLIADLMIKGDGEANTEENANNFIFACLGWQTMLYIPAIGTCPPHQYAVVDVVDGHAIPAFCSLKQDGSRTNRSLSDFLLGFGLMLPKGNLCISDDTEYCQAFEKRTVLRPEEFNIALLIKLRQIKIQWVDIITAHLEFDDATDTLFLFRYPSFCLANIPPTDFDFGVIHQCASSQSEDSKWASKEEVTQLLLEVVLSLRLLFGQSPDARRQYSKLQPFANVPAKLHDPIIEMICTREEISISPLLHERERYRLARDFPILRSRLAILQQHLATVKPSGWKQLWNDRRDSPQWYTFWAVIVIGGLGIVLAIIQIIESALQIAGCCH